MRLFLLASVLLCVMACRAPRKIMLDTYKNNETVKAYKEIVITGEGGMQSKMYLQNLTDELSKQLAKRNIRIHYIYLGDYRKLDTDEAFEKVKAGQYEALLRMVPRAADETLHKRTYDSYDRNNNNVGHNILAPKYVNEHLNDFDLTLKEKSGVIIWEGHLKTDVDPVARNIYKGISDKVVSVLVENLIIPAK